MIAEGMRAVAGAAFALFIPGYLAALIFFREMSRLQKVAIGITISIMISIAIGILLGYNASAKAATGGITPSNVWFYSLVITAFLLVMYLFTRFTKK
jgi:uncharacterized membrane protein